MQLSRGSEGGGPPGFKEFLQDWVEVSQRLSATKSARLLLAKRSGSPQRLSPQQPELAQRGSVSPAPAGAAPLGAPRFALAEEQKKDFITSLRRLRQVLIPCHAQALP